MKRAVLAALASLLLLSGCGCAALFDREVYVEEPYEAAADSVEAEDAADTMISNYAALRRAITRLVSERAESAVLQFQDYDGAISGDLSAACWEVKSSTALGAFAVDYISYDLSRIVSYTQAEIHITYKRSEYQMSALESMENLAMMRARLEEALRAGDTYLVLAITAASLTADTVREAIESAYYTDPMTCPVLPAAEAFLYPDSGVSRIVEVTLDYGLDSGSLAARREELASALAALTEAALPAEDGAGPAAADEAPGESASPEPGDPDAAAAETVRALCGSLRELCLWDESAGVTAWDALTQGAASSEGIALALEAACRAAGVECLLVDGRLDGEPHAWNIVTLGERSYHVDAARWDAGEDAVFLRGDEELWGQYWWDTSEVPACPAAWGAAPDGAASPEPEEAVLDN